MKRIDLTDLLAGLFVIGFGLYFVIGGAQYRMGTVVRMGPGFVPVSLGVVAIILGLAIIAAAFRRAGALPRIDWRQTLCVLLSVPVFALLLDRVGLIPAGFVAVLISSAALPVTRPLSNVAIAAVISLSAWAVFVLVLGMPISAIRNPFA